MKIGDLYEKQVAKDLRHLLDQPQFIRFIASMMHQSRVAAETGASDHYQQGIRDASANLLMRINSIDTECASDIIRHHLNLLVTGDFYHER